MILDRNKTELTHAVTKATVAWLEDRGCKPLESEVPIQAGWIADLGGVLAPTLTELRKLKFITSRPHWKNSNCEAWYQHAYSLQRVMTCLVEVKTSRSDFVGDKKWKLPIPTDVAYLAVPHGLVSPAEWPEDWGILEYIESSDHMRCVRVPALLSAAVEMQRDVILSIAVREIITRAMRDGVSKPKRIGSCATKRSPQRGCVT